MNSRLQQNPVSGDTTIIMRFLRPPNFNYTYFGIQDNGTAGSIIRIIVYYVVCPGRVEGLVIYPEAPHPPQGSPLTIRTARCAEHAHNTTNLETFAYNTSDGQCEQNVTCVCDLGYAEESGQTGSQCSGKPNLSNPTMTLILTVFFSIACRAGQYRSAQNNSCIDCPANSTSKEASEYCSCIDGHFRASLNEGIGVNCTGYTTTFMAQWQWPPA